MFPLKKKNKTCSALNKTACCLDTHMDTLHPQIMQQPRSCYFLTISCSFLLTLLVAVWFHTSFTVLFLILTLACGCFSFYFLMRGTRVKALVVSRTKSRKVKWSSSCSIAMITAQKRHISAFCSRRCQSVGSLPELMEAASSCWPSPSLPQYL